MANIEKISGLSLEDVRVHYNSSKPAQLQALAYTQGSEIHVAPGQERHLPHEAWHVVQQKQGRVKPTVQMKTAQINDDVRLEQEADRFGEKAIHEKSPQPTPLLQKKAFFSNQAVQRRAIWRETTVNNMDLVDTVMTGADFGFTAIIVNGHDNDQFHPRALNEPMLFWNTTKDGQVEINVAEDADNTLGTRMQLPTAPPWERDVDKDRVGGRLLGEARALGVGDQVQAYALADAGQTRLSVRGNPSDGALARLTKTHEKRHVADDKGAKEAIVDPWDARITQKRRTHAVTVGVDREAALNKFHAEIGGSGADIGRDFMAECVRLGNAFHATGPGGKPAMTSIRTAADQSTIEATWKQPVNEGLLSRLFGWA